ncbi:VanZ family protein [Sciscionella sediminilitoris]|uniref:VanZ family protein n=1 Tax=Sciscionella sediminilitoris TaxID=1445613 RepID=UPI0004DFA1CA|nr:VanZ family protein [Sciscionella sp. SE31]
MRGEAELGAAEEMLSKPGVFAATVLGSLVIGVLAWFLAGRLGWSRIAAALSACGLALALAVTLARPGVFSTPDTSGNPFASCVDSQFSLSSTENKLNFAMLMPFAFFGTIAARRPIVLMLCCAVLSGGIELFQAASGIGVCESNDFYTNTIGGILAACAGWVCYSLFGTERYRTRQS